MSLQAGLSGALKYSFNFYISSRHQFPSIQHLFINNFGQNSINRSVNVKTSPPSLNRKYFPHHPSAKTPHHHSGLRHPQKPRKLASWFCFLHFCVHSSPGVRRSQISFLRLLGKITRMSEHFPERGSFPPHARHSWRHFHCSNLILSAVSGEQRYRKVIP